MAKIKNDIKEFKKIVAGKRAEGTATGKLVDGAIIYIDTIKKFAKDYNIPQKYVKDAVILHEYIHKKYPKLSPTEFKDKFSKLYREYYPKIKKEYFEKIVNFSGHFSEADKEIYNKYGRIKVIHPESISARNSEVKPENPSSKMYYYSIEGYELDELKDFLEDCQLRYKNLEMEIFQTMTMLWIKSNKDLYAPINNNPFRYKYLELKTEPHPEKKWMGKWVDWQTKLKIIKKVLKETIKGQKNNNPNNPNMIPKYKVVYQLVDAFGAPKEKPKTAILEISGDPTYEVVNVLRRKFDIPLYERIKILDITDVHKKGNPESNIEDKKEIAKKIYQELNESEKFGCMFGLFPIRIIDKIKDKEIAAELTRIATQERRPDWLSNNPESNPDMKKYEVCYHFDGIGEKCFIIEAENKDKASQKGLEKALEVAGRGIEGIRFGITRIKELNNNNPNNSRLGLLPKEYYLDKNFHRLQKQIADELREDYRNVNFGEMSDERFEIYFDGLVADVLETLRPTEKQVKELFSIYPESPKKISEQNIKEIIDDMIDKAHEEFLREFKVGDKLGMSYYAGKETALRSLQWKLENPENPSNPESNPEFNKGREDNKINNLNLNMELPKFESYYELESYLSGKGYGHILDEIYDLEFKIRPEGWKRKDVEDMILEWWNSDLEEPSLKSERTGYFLMWHLKNEIAKRSNPSNPESNPKEGIKLGLGTESGLGKASSVDLRTLKKEKPAKYRKLKKYWEEETGYDLDEYMENEPIIWTKQGLQDEYLELSGVDPRLEPYLNVEAMIADDYDSGYFRTITIDGVDYYYRVY